MKNEDERDNVLRTHRCPECDVEQDTENGHCINCGWSRARERARDAERDRARAAHRPAPASLSARVPETNDPALETRPAEPEPIITGGETESAAGETTPTPATPAS